ncbi:hypothetical protein A3H04_03500 [Candidatus Giovannonibacteria bacterium RIFCSPLOWO2_12_FULL_43_11c]|uniref:Glycosyl transferase family 1 n=1 Tax=Candidatus Giovannonibacteria bacterium RIFCSPHIGHO2_12_FULL_43_15 TaxID=1798341 RepID=A0A1F5WPL1_9BACT|nr:MAG: hypothetical protein A2739_00240 [Candidatus Giovannonibacteria bacterium RIFCSPHIGHO2_01_FULL_43_100]OGF66487.1 MAG: hypothetical protein A3B97_01335 [Candidatus Giovannonibacteria bacterium RIFCSPHIGHO2_02_FULL_43_32]OGF77606.1 MAG: hypothetical protein A3F23_00170 [Candidatus Giovannonibacteria bacterium RIFCSPHIGHO2_12_FULL_43_15]OGF79277.1 MAG: hypothetical protein A3A15_01405 [Candidatus Giovannonibacteria bacterium RIFCSPLOWO2_01_FULL_43_60]OGF92236.1 MAG: hypothetical protein A3
MRIALFTDTFPPQVNGVANVVKSSAEVLAGRGHDVHVFTVASGRSDENSPPEKFGLTRIFSMPFFGYPNERFSLPLAWTLRKIKSFRPDIIHAHTPFAIGWEAVLSKKILGVPLVGTHHTFFDHYLKHIYADYGWAKKLSSKYVAAYYNRCDLVTSPTISLADSLESCGVSSRIIVVPNSVDTDFFKPAADKKEKERLKRQLGFSKNVLVYMGRVSYEKSIDMAIRAMSVIAKKSPEATFVIIGGGPEREKLEILTKRLGVEKKVRFMGFLYGRELAQALQASDIFVTASKSENFPLSVIEAMASGLPIVAVSALGLPEIVEDGRSGFLVSPDRPEEIADRVLKLFNNETLLEKYSSASRELSNRYSKGGIALIHEKNYEDLLIS